MVLGVCFLLTLWWGKRDWLTILTVLLAVGLLVAAWFISHAQALRFVVVSSARRGPHFPKANAATALPRSNVRSLLCLGYL